MINNINITPYKVNKEVLKFIIQYGVEYEIISDINKKHQYSHNKTTKRQDKIYIYLIWVKKYYNKIYKVL